MSFNVPLEAVEIDGHQYNLSFIILRSSQHKGWNLFFHRTDWRSEIQVPKSFYTLDLGHNGKHVYHPCAPFHLSEDECSSWLEWTELKPDKDEDFVKMLHYKQTLESLINNPDTKTGISSMIQHALWAEQLSTHAPFLGNYARMEEVVRKTVSSSTRNVANILSKTIKEQIQNFSRRSNNSDSRSPQRDRSRSPIRRSRSPIRQSRSPRRQKQTLPETNQAQTNFTPYSAPPHYYLPPQLAMQQQPQQNGTQQLQQGVQAQQWNQMMAGLAGQPQPGLLYQPPRT